jgi:phosphoenolpyruvate---glycerone phosphotransferase subunit DhaL
VRERAGHETGHNEETGTTGIVTTQAVTAWLRRFGALVAENRDLLTELDAAIGDADHGANMDRGMRAVVARLDEAGPAAGALDELLKSAGMTLVSTVGGAAGPLYGTLFLRMAAAAGPSSQIPLEAWADAFEAGVEGVKARGKAELGDKTMLDALIPAAQELTSGALIPPAQLLRRAAAAAEAGMKATVPLLARRGRASYLGERSMGHQDPGATSSWLLLEAMQVLAAASAVDTEPSRDDAGDPRAQEKRAD